MKKLALAVSVGLLGTVVLISTTAVATGDGGKSFRTKLTGYEEITPASFNAAATPPFTGEAGAISTTGNGKFTARVREDPLRIDYTLSYQALEGTTTLFAHIHFGQQHTVGGVSAFLCGGGPVPKPPCPPTSTPPGGITGTIVAADVAGPAGQGIESTNIAELIAAMQAGATYVNVHTNKWPGGEIRGQLDGRGDND
jgi:CHRD domain